MADKILQSRDQLERLLREQLRYLHNSAQLYDKGNYAEAKRLAVSIRVLVHDTKSSKSLLGQLGLKTNRFLDTAIQRSSNVITAYLGLVSTFMNGREVEFVPLYDSTKGAIRLLDFNTWWTIPIFIDDQGRAISRRDLVLVAANQDGGAHVDPEIDSTYVRLARGSSLDHLRFNGRSWEAIPNAESAALRQIAHEILITLQPDISPPMPSMREGYYIASELQIISEEAFSTVNKGSIRGRNKIGRNEPCPCGSGKKYKKCCGR